MVYSLVSGCEREIQISATSQSGPHMAWEGHFLYCLLCTVYDKLYKKMNKNSKQLKVIMFTQLVNRDKRLQH